jgi:hypothetical protein
MKHHHYCETVKNTQYCYPECEILIEDKRMKPVLERS